MSVEKFIFHHPEVYRRLLVAGCLGMLVSGMASMVVGHQPAQAASDWQVVGQLMKPVTLTPAAAVSPTQVLPGKDGNVSSAQVQADTAPPPVATPAPSQAAAAVMAALTNNGDTRGLGRSMNAAMFGDQYWEALNQLWTRESNWNPLAANRSGACGIPQALPCSKIPDHSPQGQITWGLHYIQGRYGNPGNAWEHERRFGWY